MAKEGYNRSNHNDFKTTTELRDSKFSGLRLNSITKNYEIWIAGNIERQITETEILLDADAVNKAWRETFKF